jgi:hypothetical protein
MACRGSYTERLASRCGERKGREPNAHSSEALESPSQNGRQATPDVGVSWAGFCDKILQISDEPQPKLRKFQLLAFGSLVSDSFHSVLQIKPSLRGMGNSCVWNVRTSARCSRRGPRD